MESLNFTVNAQELSSQITKLLDEETINKIAKETGFTQREGGKLDGFKFLDMLLFTHFNHKELSLNDLSVQLKKRFGIIISRQSIDERFTGGAVRFFKVILEKAMSLTSISELKFNFDKFKKVRIKDSTSYQLPENMKDKYPGSGGSASKAAIRIQFEYDLKNREILDLSLNPLTVQDMTDAKNTIDNIEPNELIIRDLGYIKIALLQKIEEQGGFYLNRLKSNVGVYELKNDIYVEIDFKKLFKQMNKNKISHIEKQVYIGAKHFKTRIIIERLPAKIYKERLKKAEANAKSRKQKLSDAYKSRLGLNIFITNTDIPIKDIRLLYTTRWQIELMFKIWKSIGEIDEVKKMKVERFEASLFAKLIFILINWHIMNRIAIYFFNEQKIEISPYKLFKTLNQSMMELRQCIKNGEKQMELFIEEIVIMSPDNHKSEKKKGSKNWFYEVIQILLTN